MNKIIVLIFLIGTLTTYSQQEAEMEVRKTIERFFEGFHNQDSTVMRSVLAANPILQTIGENPEGEVRVRHVPFDALIKAIVSIPDSVAFEERIKSYKIRIDGPMANAWTAYEFWRNNAFSHCGVNSFQLYHDGSSWKILYLIDTRRKEDCP
ncbi:nuclear transport factor 2 family protein [Lentiprolixibacter aurantiacus]|uniref:Nuclear transport factor 2 family protein n=1 Tax=Lentiprolixibacter aurantiacus TaxID=2993939 RepID=A0AAE3SNB2_9FLAO|nr:nuclear transport factor 2 family protein [Lentiprolixibacter aurantiacus]MCX2719429.1 nuclear transport factor 2 family protein [Lentiprolixibacter aurantiacus]